jgi:deoxyhypusine synthase
MTAPTGAQDAVLKPSDPVPEGAVPVVGLDFDKFAGRNITVAEMVESMTNMGFQATSVGQAAQIINGMVMHSEYPRIDNTTDLWATA